MSVGECNIISDETVMEVNDPPWFDGGSFSWPIPNAWRMCDDFGRTNVFVQPISILFLMQKEQRECLSLAM